MLPEGDLMMALRNVAKRLPWVLLVLASATLVAIGTRHRALRESFLDHRRADMRVQHGGYVPAFTALSVSGEVVTVGESQMQGRQVLIFLTSACPFCRETLPTWKRMAERLSSSVPGQNVQLVALTTDSMKTAKAYAVSNRLPFPLVPFPNRRSAWLYRGLVVPQTIVIDHDGRVLFARHGVVNTTNAVDSIIAAVRGDRGDRGGTPLAQVRADGNGDRNAAATGDRGTP